MIDRLVRGAALLCGVLLVAGVLSGCALIADEDQKRTVRENLEALPDDVDQALRPGRIRLHYYGEVGTDVGADRRIELRVGAPLPTTLGRWVAGCRAMVAALAPTSARLYGKLPGDGPEYEATDELCQRGLGHPLHPSGEELWIGLPQPDRRVLNTAVSFDPIEGTIETFTRQARHGLRWERGRLFAVGVPDLAELDRTLPTADLPWGLPTELVGAKGDLAEPRLTFVVPAGTRLRIRADCGEPAPDRIIELTVREPGNRLSFRRAAPASSPSPGQHRVGCGQQLVEPLRPQLSYRSATGAQVDRYQVAVSPDPRRGDRPDPPQWTVVVEPAP